RELTLTGSSEDDDLDTLSRETGDKLREAVGIPSPGRRIAPRKDPDSRPAGRPHQLLPGIAERVGDREARERWRAVGGATGDELEVGGGAVHPHEGARGDGVAQEEGPPVRCRTAALADAAEREEERGGKRRREQDTASVAAFPQHTGRAEESGAATVEREDQ